MYPIPELPSMAQIRSAADKALAEVGFKRVRGAGYVRRIDEDFSLSVFPHGREGGQSANVGAIYKPACVAAVELWDQVGRHWIKGRRELSLGTPAEATTFCSGPVRDPNAQQRHWTFFDLPSVGKAASLEEFAADLADIASNHVRSNPDIRTALASAEMWFTVPYELRSTVHAMLGDEEGFTKNTQPALAYMEQLKQMLEARNETIAPEFTPDFAAYFDAVRARFFAA